MDFVTAMHQRRHDGGPVEGEVPPALLFPADGDQLAVQGIHVDGGHAAPELAGQVATQHTALMAHRSLTQPGGRQGRHQGHRHLSGGLDPLRSLCLDEEAAALGRICHHRLQQGREGADGANFTPHHLGLVNAVVAQPLQEVVQIAGLQAVDVGSLQGCQQLGRCFQPLAIPLHASKAHDPAKHFG